MKYLRPFLLVLFLLPARSFSQENFTQVGIASYYGKEFHGKKTSNGERFSMYSLTAAHQTLPYNSLVRVTNLANDKSVVVRINDCGPFKDDRIIDLTKAAAIRIGMITSGTAKVRLEVLESDATTNDFYKIDIKKLDLKGFAIQVGSFSDFQNMMSQLHALRKLHLENVYVQERMVRGKKVHRIVMGGFPTRADAERFLPELRKLGKKGFVFQVR